MGDAEIAELGGAARVEEHVRRLDVAVHDAAVMRGLESADDVERHPADLGRRQPLPRGEPLLERAAGEVFHDQEAALDRDVVDLDQRRVPQRGGEPGLAHEPLVGGAAARAGSEEHLDRDAAAGDLVDREEHAARGASTEQPVDAIAARDDLAIATRLALGVGIPPRPQVRVEIGGHLGIVDAQLEQRVARAVAEAHRGERRHEVALRLDPQLGVPARLLQQPRRVVVRPATGKDPAERELERRLLGGRREVERALEQPPGLAIAALGLEQAGRVDVVVGARVQIDRAVEVADALRDRRRDRVAAHPGQHVERLARAVLVDRQLFEHAVDRGRVVELDRVAQGPGQVATATRGLVGPPEVPQLLVEIGGARELAVRQRGLRGRDGIGLV